MASLPMDVDTVSTKSNESLTTELDELLGQFKAIESYHTEIIVKLQEMQSKYLGNSSAVQATIKECREKAVKEAKKGKNTLGKALMEKL